MAAEITLPELLNTQGAYQLLDALKAARDQDVTLVADQVHHVGAQAVQLLLAARVAWETAGKKLTISQASNEMREGLELLGAAAQLKEATNG